MEDTQTVNTKTKVLKNGAVYDLDKKQIVANPGGGTAAITHANASALAQKRWEKYRRAAVREIVEEAKSINPAVATSADVFGLLVANQFTKLMDSQKPDIFQVEKLGKMLTGMEAEPRRENAGAAPNSVTFSTDALLDILTRIEADKRHAVEAARSIDGTATDIRNE